MEPAPDTERVFTTEEQIPRHEHVLDIAPRQLREHGVERREVAVHVREDRQRSTDHVFLEARHEAGL